MKVLELEKALAASQRDTLQAQETAKKTAVEMQASLEAAQSARKQAEEVSPTSVTLRSLSHVPLKFSHSGTTPCVLEVHFLERYSLTPCTLRLFVFLNSVLFSIFLSYTQNTTSTSAILRLLPRQTPRRPMLKPNWRKPSSMPLPNPPRLLRRLRLRLAVEAAPRQPSLLRSKKRMTFATKSQPSSFRWKR